MSVTFICNLTGYRHRKLRKKDGQSAAYEDFSLKRRLFFAFSLLSASVQCALADEMPNAPQPPAIQAGAWVLMDYTTGQILTAGNEHQQRNPASLTKLMTG